MKRGLILVVGALAALGCARLGIWQLSRLDERRVSNAQIAGRRAAQPLTLDAEILNDPPPIDSLVHRRASAVGRFDFSRETVVWLRSRNGVPGVHVATPLMVDDTSAVLVERAWLPSPDGRTTDLERAREPVVARVAGHLVDPAPSRVTPPSEAWFPLGLTSPDPDIVSEQVPYHVFPLVLRRTELPPELNSMDLPVDPPLSEGSHLSYAIQWFAFATIALVGSVILFWKTER